MQTRRLTAGVLALTLALAMGVAGARSKDEKPDGTVSLKGTSAAIGIGGTWGSGTLTYKGKSHAIRMRGFDVGSVGGASITAHGDVYHLKDLADFDGTYAAVEAAGAAGPAGVGRTAMRNDKGVVIELASDREGVEVKASVDGVKLELVR